MLEWCRTGGFPASLYFRETSPNSGWLCIISLTGFIGLRHPSTEMFRTHFSFWTAHCSPFLDPEGTCSLCSAERKAIGSCICINFHFPLWKYHWIIFRRIKLEKYTVPHTTHWIRKLPSAVGAEDGSITMCLRGSLVAFSTHGWIFDIGWLRLHQLLPLT